MQLLEVPFPALRPGCILVRNHFSVISAGTEGKTVSDARKGYIGKARSRKDEVKKVVQAARTHGVMKTYKMVMNKLESPSPLGYSCAGEVLAVASDVREFKVGDHVACAGGTAVHAEVVSVPTNLAVKVADDVNLEHAAFTTIASIALQGIRQADLRLGENAVVIGLGLIGQLTLQLLKAGGITPIGIDIDERQVALARETDNPLSFLRKDPHLEEQILRATGGHGTDAVIITAGTSSTDPVELAGNLSRKKGKVIIVGAVPTGFSRKHYFKKELDLRMSSSYGPGRYDNNYEEKGLDYPIGYVRWTENRNMQAFAALLAEGKIEMQPLLTHQYAFEQAPEAYQLILDKSEPFVGITLRYDLSKTLSASVQIEDKKAAPGTPSIGFVGAGSFAQNFLLPAVGKDYPLLNVATARANNARKIADKYGFAACTGEASEVIGQTDINTIFIATRHDSHARYVLEAIKAGKHVFVEKPLCMTEEELEAIAEAAAQGSSLVMVGFNRRFAPQILEAVSSLQQHDLPRAIQYRINAGAVAPDHWIHDPEVGGGRIIGEACHFIDLATFLAGSKVASVSATSLPDPQHKHDSVAINLAFENGGTANISYFSNGSKAMSKEYLEVFCGGQVTVIDDFKSAAHYGATAKRTKLGGQDKGHQAEVQAFLRAIKQGGAAPISFADCYHSTLVTFKVLASLRENGARIKL